MQNPWEKLPSKKPFILESDKKLIDFHNQKSKSIHKVITEMYPEPFFGNIDAEILILNLNPGFGGQADIEQHETNEYFITLLTKNLLHEKIEYPFLFLDPKISNTPGYGWWNKRLRTLIEDVGREKLAKSLLCLELFPYHSSKYKFKGKVASQEYNFFLLRKAMERNAIVVSFRGYEKWTSHVPELSNYQNLYRLNSPQAVYLTQNNCPEGYPIITKKLKS